MICGKFVILNQNPVTLQNENNETPAFSATERRR